MSDTNVITFTSPGETVDPLTDLLRSGARTLLSQAIEAEIEELLSLHSDIRDASGKRAVVRNGYLPSRQVQTGIGSVEVQVPRVRDRSGNGITFHSSLIPPYLRRSKSIETLLPVLYLKGISTGDFSETLSALLGKDCTGVGLWACVYQPRTAAIGRETRHCVDLHSARKATAECLCRAI